MTSRSSPGARVVLALCVLLALGAAAPGTAPATVQAAPPAAPFSYTVNSTNDVVADFTNDPGFTVCHTAPSNSTCTLRAAIMNANRHTGSAIIHLPPGTYQLAIAPGIIDFDDAHGSLDISNTVTLAATGAASSAIVDGGGLDTVFLVNSSGVFTITGLTIQHGSATSAGGIYNEGQLSLSDSVLHDNHAGGGGGGLYNLGQAVISHSTLFSNTANVGGAAANYGQLIINTSSLHHNGAIFGGAVFGIGNLTVFDSTFSNNTASMGGGALDSGGTASFYHSSLVGNLADNDGNGSGDGGAIANSQPASHIHLYNTLLADNYISHTLNDCSSGLTSHDYNLFQTTAGCPIAGSATHDVKNIADPLLDALADNGGGTLTRALLAGSPALDQIPANLNGPCRDPFGSAPVPDQRGVARPVNGLCDIGAYEGQVVRGFFGRNLVRNGDAEAGAASPTDAWVGVPDWTGTGQLTVGPYSGGNGFPSVPTSTLHVDFGANLFAGGNITDSIGDQQISLAPISRTVDSGAVRYTFSALLGGFADQGDYAEALISFEDAQLVVIGSPIVLGPVTAADRANTTSLLPVSHSALVPVGARQVGVRIVLTRLSGPGTHNNGYADNISLVIAPLPLFLPVLLR